MWKFFSHEQYWCKLIKYTYVTNETRWVEIRTKGGKRNYLCTFYASIKMITLIDYIWYFQHLQVMCLSDKLYPYSNWIQLRDLTVGTFLSFARYENHHDQVLRIIFFLSVVVHLNVSYTYVSKCVRICVNRLTYNLYDVGLCHCALFNVLMRWQVKNTIWQDSWYSKWKKFWHENAWMTSS